MIPQTKDGMFFKGMKFSPTENITQGDLNRITVHLLRRFFLNNNNEMIDVKHEDIDSMLTLVQFLVDLDISMDDESFQYIPKELRYMFLVKQRDGKEYRYGNRPRWL